MTARPLPRIEAARVSVSTVYVEAIQVWFQCPHCEEQLEGFLSDPRGVRDICCNDCGGRFDIAQRANLVIT